MIRTLSLALVIFCAVGGALKAQTATTTVQNNATPQPPVKKVVTHYGPLVTQSSANLTINIGDVGFTGSLPFDEAFGITVPIDTTIVNVMVWHRLKPKKDDASFKDRPTEADDKDWTRLEAYPPVGTSVNHQFTVPALKPNKYYQFFFKYKLKPDAIDKAELATFTKDVIGSALKNKALSATSGESDFEFTNGEVAQIITDIKSKITIYVARKNLSVDLSMINNTQYENLFNTLKYVSSAYEAIKGYKGNIEGTNDNFVAIQKRFELYRDRYKTKGQGAVIKSNVKLMDEITQAFIVFLSPPLDPIAITPVHVKGYQDTCTLILSKLDEISITKDADYAALKKDITEYVGSNQYQIQQYYQSILDAAALLNSKSGSFTDIVTSNLFNDIIIDGTTTSGDFNTSASYYISGDLGVAAIPQFSKVVPYFGTNIYLRPVNKDITLAASPPDDTFWDDFGRRFSFMFGISIGSVAKTNYRTDLFGGNFNLITGAGFRITDYFRLNAGTLWYQKLNDNPLNSNSSIAPAFFMSFSIDLDVKTALDNLFPTRKVTN